MLDVDFCSPPTREISHHVFHVPQVIRICYHIDISYTPAAAIDRDDASNASAKRRVHNGWLAIHIFDTNGAPAWGLVSRSDQESGNMIGTIDRIESSTLFAAAVAM